MGAVPTIMTLRFTTLLAPLSLLLAASLLTGKEAEIPEQEASVKPGINKGFLDPELKVDDWLKRFEVESRETYHERHKVVKACGIKKGMKIADIGAGTGLYTRLFSKETGPEGWVYAIDISGPFLKHIVARAQQENQQNISAILSPENATPLPPNSLDMAFLCDTYHHFEYPKGTMDSLVRALKKGGTLVVIDFERIEGKSREWLMGHVRAGKEVFRKEIEGAGLTLIEEIKIEGFKENYFLRFRKD
ncbi:MAG: ubiquinone/menaquinone biosynthesis C-methylase UbiE [Akkermansiaceae bacterium]|jgi:ubiquinone/menaquinone biosynthesis C-methylase UbiE